MTKLNYELRHNRTIRPTAKFKFYAVRRGRTTGIFYKWYGFGGANEAIENFEGASFRGFYNEDDALAWLTDGVLQQNEMQHIQFADKMEFARVCYRRKNNSKQQKKIVCEGQPCRKCLTPVIKKIPRGKRKLNQTYYFEYYLFCPKCHTNYMVEEAKRYYE